jgi:hypothetical protein
VPRRLPRRPLKGFIASSQAGVAPRPRTDRPGCGARRKQSGWVMGRSRSGSGRSPYSNAAAPRTAIHRLSSNSRINPGLGLTGWLAASTPSPAAPTQWDQGRFGTAQGEAVLGTDEPVLHRPELQAGIGVFHPPATAWHRSGSSSKVRGNRIMNRVAADKGGSVRSGVWASRSPPAAWRAEPASAPPQHWRWASRRRPSSPGACRTGVGPGRPTTAP